MSRALLAAGMAVLVSLGLAAPAHAVTAADKLAVLSSFTQTDLASFLRWDDARENRGAWSQYTLDWSTDYCSGSPDNPLGFDFTLSCWRHDFGYRNYKVVNAFPANKSRVDSAFYADLKRRCATYSSVVRPACNSLAWTYYQAVKNFGSLAAVSQADLDAAAAQKAKALAAARR